MIWKPAADITKRINYLIGKLNMSSVVSDHVYCFKSFGSSSRATARIWSLPKIWQIALAVDPGYCLEVITERFDKLSPADQEKVLIHELLHIPSTFSGSLVPHRNARHRTLRHYHDTVESLFRSLKVKSYE